MKEVLHPARHRRCTFQLVKKIPLALALVFIGFVFPAFGSVVRTETKVVEYDGVSVPLIEISGALKQSGVEKIVRALRQAESTKPPFIVITFDSQGGELAGALEIADTINSLSVPTIGLVNEGMGGSVVMIAAVDQIYFSAEGVCGAASSAMVNSTPEAADMARKIRTYLGTKMKFYAEANGHDADIFLAMTDPDTELTRGAKVWKTKGNLLRLTAPKALAIGLSAGTVESLAGVFPIRKNKAADQPDQPAPSESIVVPPELLQRYLAAKQIKVEYRPVFRGEGEVLVGSLVRPDGVIVATRTPISKDGSFATAVYPGRKLIFYAHGYDALVVDQGVKVLPSLRDVGAQTFTRASPERLRSVAGNVALDVPASSTPVQIEAVLGITNSAYLYRDHGHRGGNISAKVKTLTLNSGDAFRFEGLSAIPYDLKLSASGYISRKLPIDPGASGEIALGSLSLTRAPVLEFNYVAQLDLKAVADWDTSAPGTQRVTCNGDTRFTYTDVRDKHRNQFYLRLNPLESGVEASFWAFPCRFYDLGQGVLKTFLDNREWVARLAELKPADRAVLQPDHVYFFHEPSRGTNCLFAVGPAGPGAP